MKIKHRKYSKEGIIKNILSFYSLASLSELNEGKLWYPKANEFAKKLANEFNVSVQQVAGIIAACSPQTSWDVNRTYSIKFLLNPAKFRKKSKVQIDKCKAILKTANEGDIYELQGKGMKTKRFMLNILHPELNFVTIDRHAWAICHQKPDNVYALERVEFTLAQYEFLESCYIEAAQRVGLLPTELQAITWGVYRRLRELKDITPF